MAYSKSLSCKSQVWLSERSSIFLLEFLGGWQSKVILRESNQSSWHFIECNPSAIIMLNGSINVVFRANQAYGHGESLALATAVHWNSTYEVDETPVLPEGIQHGNNEDPFAWVDKRGNFHIVTHEQGEGCICGQEYGSTCAAHLYARSVRGPWIVSKYPTYTDNVTLVNGTKTQFLTRQRPQIIFNSEGNPTHLFNGDMFTHTLCLWV
eukprot:m.239762 g.239762  ORF g.239762 m.239762 type:complete len:209 (+) comp16072_c0_seq8:708-1334(+)